jgi:NAD(P)-dependent dehydrogenase (short-subunit alcohol dehydrogenase family)
MTQDLRGLSAVVTGGGDGIGRAIALNLAGLGMNLAILDIRDDAAHQTAKDCEDRGARAVALGCDASVQEEIEAAAEAVRRALGPISLC